MAGKPPGGLPDRKRVAILDPRDQTRRTRCGLSTITAEHTVDRLCQKTETSSVYDCIVEDVELRYSHIFFFARNIKVMKMYVQMYFITNANRQYCTKERSAAILD